MRSSIHSRIEAKRVAITGAGGGLGRAMAIRFAEQGWKVAIADINATAMQECFDTVIGHSKDSFIQHCDVRQEADFEKLLTKCNERWGGVDVLVNNAGIASINSIHKESIDSWQRIVDINTLGAVRGCKVFVPALKKQGGGHIVNIASVAGISCTPHMSSYNTTKAAVIALSETLRWELKSANIGVTVVCPSMFKTGLADSSGVENGKIKGNLEKMMAASKLSADDIAESIYTAVQKNTFMLLPHKSSRWLWWLKRLSPDLYQYYMSR
ncbi:MAG: NADP-dependent 3-hydroxy acid dehydrogenase YdfG [Zhongshania sp.]|jgi:NADP-dependent 3-hydroxy acid dehydrogenase YdfG